MNNNSKKKFIVTIKVIIVHIFLILILDLNAISNLKKNKNSFNEINNAQFLNLKSISQEDIEEYRKLIRKKKAEEKKKRKIEADRKKKAEEKKKRKIEADRKKKAEEKKKRKIEADRKKKEILENLKKEEEIDLINHDRLELEKELLEMEKYELLVRQQIIRNSQLSDAEAKYILNIKSRIENNWLIPHDIKHDKICTAIVNQLPSGKITNVKIHGCTGDTLYVDSLINAVWKSSPLPIAPDIEVFQENLILQFKGPN
jgi:colicin import membrane protein